MRRRTLLAAAGALTLSPLLAAVPAHADEAANVDVVKAYLAAWNAHDIDAAVGHFADGVVYFDSSVGAPVEGKEAARTGVVASFINAVPDLKWVMQGEPVASGDKVAFEWAFSGTNTGAGGDGTAASGKAFSFTGASIFEIKDGKIVHQSDYYDALGFYKQLGWL